VSHVPQPGESIAGSGFTVFPGGKGGNQAYASARLGASVSMVGQIGNDAHADWLKRNLAEAGVDVSHVLTDADVSSGVAFISIDEAGQNQIVVVAGSNGTFGTSKLVPSRELIRGARTVLIQLEVPMETVETAARHAREGGAIVILDPAPAVALSDELLGYVDYLTPNESELAILTGAPVEEAIEVAELSRRAHQLRARGANNVIVKMGARGALLVDGNGEHLLAPKAVEAVDTTAAGDAFNAAFAFALEGADSAIEAGRFATAAAACSVMRHGAQPSMPTLDEVARMLAQ
jgi:ribokinase